MKRLLVLAAALAAAITGPSRADIFHLTYEAPGVENSTTSFTLGGFTTFNTRTSEIGFSTTFHTGGAITATYTPVQINTADQYGGAGGTGKYSVAFNNTPFSMA